MVPILFQDSGITITNTTLSSPQNIYNTEKQYKKVQIIPTFRNSL